MNKSTTILATFAGICVISTSLFAEGKVKSTTKHAVAFAENALKQMLKATDRKQALAWDQAFRVELVNPSEQADYEALLRTLARNSRPIQQIQRHEPLLLLVANQRFQNALKLAQSANQDPTSPSLHDTLALSLRYSTQQNLRKKRGKLSPPVDAEIKKGFGPEKLKGTKATLRHTGVSFDVSVGTSVKSIGKGLVVYARHFEGFGKTVIVDHGSDFHSVYSFFSEMDVVQGQEVKSNTILGTSGKSDSGDAELYFEIRLNGDAVDPEPFFSL